jgi:ABC-type uncharacterized transport system ATPase subunit
MNKFAVLTQNVFEVFARGARPIVQQTQVLPDYGLLCDFIPILARQTEVHSVQKRKIRKNTSDDNLKMLKRWN